MPPRQPTAPSTPTANDTSVVRPADGNPWNFRRCLVARCRRPFYARGLCGLHYQRWRRGAPLDPPRQRLPASFKVFTG